MPLYFLTGNSGKFSEVKALIPEVEQCDIDLDELQEMDPKKVIEHKLQQAFKMQSGELMVEDTSLYFDGLNGLPGPLVKWFMKKLGNEKLAELAIKTGNVNATAKVIIGFAKNPQEITYFEGEVRGSIVPPRGVNGFGWDVIFQPQGINKTFGEMNEAEKQIYNMRVIATEKLKEFLDR